jgi:hypothetical protein
MNRPEQVEEGSVVENLLVFSTWSAYSKTGSPEKNSPENSIEHTLMGLA